jgi:hypothetical protein
MMCVLIWKVAKRPVMSLSKVTEAPQTWKWSDPHMCGYQTSFFWDRTTFIGSLVPSFASVESAEALPVHLVDDGYR